MAEHNIFRRCLTYTSYDIKYTYTCSVYDFYKCIEHAVNKGEIKSVINDKDRAKKTHDFFEQCVDPCCVLPDMFRPFGFIMLFHNSFDAFEKDLGNIQTIKKLFNRLDQKIKFPKISPCASPLIAEKDSLDPQKRANYERLVTYKTYKGPTPEVWSIVWSLRGSISREVLYNNMTKTNNGEVILMEPQTIIDEMNGNIDHKCIITFNSYYYSMFYYLELWLYVSSPNYWKGYGAEIWYTYCCLVSCVAAQFGNMGLFDISPFKLKYNKYSGHRLQTVYENLLGFNEDWLSRLLDKLLQGTDVNFPCPLKRTKAFQFLERIHTDEILDVLPPKAKNKLRMVIKNVVRRINGPN